MIAAAVLSACTPNPAPPTAAVAVTVTLPAVETAEETASPTLAANTATFTPDATRTPVVWMETGTASSLPHTWTPETTFTLTPFPTQTLTPTLGPSPRFTRTATPTATPTQTRTPGDAPLRISRPGLYSRITSPYKIEAMITRGEDGFVYLSIKGEDQRLIYAQALDYRRSTYNRFMVVPQIEFSIPAVAETARLTLETHDLLGRVTALSSVDVVLLSIGDTQTNPPQRLYEPFLIEHPNYGAVIQGGRLVVNGQVEPLNDSPVFVEIIGENGETLSSKTLHLAEQQGERKHIPVAVELAYSITAETRALLVIRQESNNSIPGTIALSSIAVTLYP